jgi:TDG/mug DNA glycosylase family protein
MERATVDVYERGALRWARERSAGDLALPRAFARDVPVGALRLDVGCGPGWHAAELGRPLVAFDAAPAMLVEARRLTKGDTLLLAADLEALPFAPGAFAGAWAHKSLMHVPAERLPLALADLHRVLAVGAPLHMRLTSARRDASQTDAFAGRHFSGWELDHLVRVTIGAGFEVRSAHDDGDEWLDIAACRIRTLADIVGAGMRVLCVGLNPSEFAADAGVGFARPGNRFWPAAIGAGLVARTRDPLDALLAHGVGFTDLVKRATPRADAITRAEFAAGAARVRALVEWLAPSAVCFLGITGYRQVIDRRAQLGWQPERFGGAATYVMPNPSGINAHARLETLVANLVELQRGAP